MERKGLAKTFMIIANWQNPLVSMVYTNIYQRFNRYSSGIDFSRQNLTYVDVRFL